MSKPACRQDNIWFHFLPHDSIHRTNCCCCYDSTSKTTNDFLFSFRTCRFLILGWTRHFGIIICTKEKDIFYIQQGHNTTQYNKRKREGSFWKIWCQHDTILFLCVWIKYRRKRVLSTGRGRLSECREMVSFHTSHTSAAESQPVEN